MNKAKNIGKFIISSITLVAAIIAICTFFYAPKAKIEITLKDKLLLSQPFSNSNIDYKILYRDSIEIDSLFRTVYIVKNIGSEVIYGKGINQTILDDNIKLTIDNYEKAISLRVLNNNIGAELTVDKLSFKQWRSNEFVEIEIISKGNKYAKLTIDEDEFINVEVEHNKYTISDINILKITNSALFIYWLLLLIVFICATIIADMFFYLKPKECSTTKVIRIYSYLAVIVSFGIYLMILLHFK